MVATPGCELRILLINYEYPPVGGGAANATRETAQALARLGHQAVVLTARARWRKAGESSGVTLIEVPAPRRRKDQSSIFEMSMFLTSALCRIRACLKRERIDGMIAYFSIPCGPIAWWGWRKTNVPYIVSLRGGDVPGNEPGLALVHAALKPLRRVVFKNALAVVANSEGLRDQALLTDQVASVIIPNGVNTDFWTPEAGGTTSLTRRLIYVGRFHRQKNLSWLIQQLALLSRDSDLPAWEFIFVGDGPERNRLQTLAIEAGVSPKVRWTGWLTKEELRDIYRGAHALIHPSHYEGLSNSVLEALACGLFVLASDHSSKSDFLIQQPSLKRFKDAPSFQRGVRDILSAPKNTLPCTQLSWTTCAQRLLDLFDPTGATQSGGTT